MIVLAKHAFFLILLVTLISCRENFDDKVPFTGENLLVVEGEINDGPGPYQVKLTRSGSFGSNKQVNETKAEVYVSDNFSKRYNFKEASAGLYYSDSIEFRGKTGQTYVLHIKTADNLEYESTPCTIGSPYKLDSVFVSSALTSSIQVNGNITFRSDQNINIKIDVDLAQQNLIDSIHLASIYESHYEYHYISKYYTTKHLNNNPVLKSNTDYINGSRIMNVPLFNYNINIPHEQCVGLDELNFLRFSTGRKIYFIINVSTISNETYNYYNNLLMQTEGRDVFFEPLPVQLTGNIRCLNGKNKMPYGIFQANAKVKTYFMFDYTNFHITETTRIPSKTYDTIRCHLACSDVTLTHMVPYGSNELDMVSNAEVYIVYSTNEYFLFEEQNPGVYLCSKIRYNYFDGLCYFLTKGREEVCNNTYFVRINTND